ncbi:Levodione reductase [Roseivivax jejudonensis]|uniref:Levodione reductase n=1 Tax=Roseivivax jejudonensis TaxID=1529041 RepID=A0A1X6YHW4_9RHOB|nr:SDR family NAD(P)-dependent oxidoreductase [Roseivivax jejudonensis]SLN21884.1 Levodione reductase [Roseivivax jejudonensis]
MQISDAVAVVSGGASGLGRATVRHLAARGARVAVIDRDAEAAEAAALEVGGVALSADVTDSAAVGSAIDAAAKALGATPRIAVNCAGIAPAARIVGRDGELSVDLFAQVVGVNLIGSFTVMSHAARVMSALDPLDTGERGVIINTASIAFEEGQIGQCAYAASKGGVAAMGLPAARELARHGIRVISIAPGLFHTPMMEGLPPETTEAIAGTIPFPSRLGDPDEFAHLVGSIVENAYLNGTTVRLDGAVRLPPR